jgi:hypothetical protein
MAVAILIIPLATMLLWLLSIRPYCRRNGKGYTPGANIGVTFWIDWQEAAEISKAKDNKGMIMICRCVLLLHIIAFVILVCAIL